MSTVKIGDTFRYEGATVAVVAVGGPGDAFPVRDGEIGVRALTRADGVKLGWLPVTSGEYEAFRDLGEFLAVASPVGDNTPSLVELDQREAADRLADTAWAMLGDRMVCAAMNDIPGRSANDLRTAVADYRAAVSS